MLRTYLRFHPDPPGGGSLANDSSDESIPMTAIASVKPGVPTDIGSPKIRALEQRLAGGKHEDNWKRTPNLTGAGAIHVKSFHCKLTGESLDFIDKQINEWLDAHPQYEVKLVTSTVGEWSGKMKEPNLILQIWV